MTVLNFLSVWQRKESRGQTIYEEYIPQVNFAGVNTNLVAVSSRCISLFFLCVRQVERYMLTLENEKLMFMVALNDGNYLQQIITLVLTFYKTSKNSRTIVCEKVRQQNKRKNRQAARPKKTIPGSEYRILLYFTLRICVNPVH